MKNSVTQKLYGRAFCSPDGREVQVDWSNTLRYHDYQISRAVELIFAKPEGWFFLTFVAEDSCRIAITAAGRCAQAEECPVLAILDWDDLPTGTTRRVEAAIQNAVLKEEQNIDYATVGDPRSVATATEDDAATIGRGIGSVK